VQRTVLLLAVVAALVAGVGLASIGTAQSGAGVPAGGFEQMDVDPDDILLEVTVEPDGDAVWEAQYRIRLATDDEEQAFEDLRADIEANPGTYTGRFGERMSSAAAVAENATGATWPSRTPLSPPSGANFRSRTASSSLPVRVEQLRGDRRRPPPRRRRGRRAVPR